MMNIASLPEPIAAYFKADRQDGSAVARCFTNDGIVIDEKKTYTGLAEIEAWKTASSAQFDYTAQPIQLQKMDNSWVVTSRVTGNFPGSPVDLQLNFMLERGKIAFLEITP